MARNVRGLAGWLALLEQIPEDVKVAMEAALDESADELSEAIKRVAPVSELDPHPGALRDSIHVEKGRHDLQRYVVIDAADAKGNFYAAHVEFGYRTKNGQHVPGRPFAFPTRNLLSRSFNKRINNALRGAIRKKAPNVE